MCDRNHNCLCIDSFKQQNKANDSEICKSFDFGTALEKVYPLLEIIFEKLPYDDLKSAILVNNAWGKYGHTELQKRNAPSWVSLIKTKKSKPTVEKSNNFKFSNITFGLIFYSYPLIELSKYLCLHDAVNVRRMTFLEYLANDIMPANTDFWAFSCSHIYTPELIVTDHQSYFSGLFIPEIPNIIVKRFIISPEEIDTFFHDNPFVNEHIHCVLLFGMTLVRDSNIKHFIKKLVARQSISSIALCGGFTSNGIKPVQRDLIKKVYKSNTMFCITMSQDKSKSAPFDSYSTVISDKYDFAEKLQEFKEKISLREHSFAFRVCCAAKADKKNEVSIFNKIFPKTFVVGLDADGEIGWNKFDSWRPEDTPKIKKQKIALPRCHHQYTTIIVIITWGKQLPTSNS